jgi:hypothetical protein
LKFCYCLIFLDHVVVKKMEENRGIYYILRFSNKKRFDLHPKQASYRISELPDYHSMSSRE